MAKVKRRSGNQQQEEKQVAEATAVIHGDILEAILSHVPLIYLLSARHVSKSWNRAVSSSLHFNGPKPWLLVHTQAIRPPHATTTHAYDPRSHLWIEINQSPPSIHQMGNLQSAHSTLLYMFSPTRFSFSVDPLHLTWHHVDAPRVWRSDPIVSLVGTKIVIAGGACDFEDDPLAVEMYDVETRTWDACESMPEILLECAASTWISTAVYNNKMYVMEKSSGIGHCFDPMSKIWSGPFDFRPDEKIYNLVIECADSRLILVGLTGNYFDPQSVKIWEVNITGHEENEKLLFREIGEMPKHMVKKLKGENNGVTSLAINLIGDFLYIHNPAAPEEIIVSEMVVVNGVFGGNWKWRSVHNLVVNDRTRIMDKFVFTCSNVGLGELQKAFMSANRKFTVKS